VLNPFADDAATLRLISAAQNVPSAHQPWSFWIRSDDRIELRANFDGHAARRSGDRIRPLNIVHPLYREPVISAGMALFNLRLAIRVSGHDVGAWLLPDPDNDPFLLASVEIVTGRVRRPSVAVQEMYDTIGRRHPLPADFRGPAVPENIIAAMVLASFKKHGFLRLLTRQQANLWLQEAETARRELASDPAFGGELREWTGESTWELGPSAPPLHPVPDGERARDGAAAGPAGPERTGRRFPARWARRQRTTPPQLMALSTRGDRPLDWLNAGQAVQRAMLVGARYGASVSFLSQPLQLADIRASRAGDPAPRQWQWKWPFSEVPQLGLRVGYTGAAEPGTAERLGVRDPEVFDLRGGQPRRVQLPDRRKPFEAA
jgi:hypothetical protein